MEPLASRHIAFLTDLWIHNGSYLSGFLGGTALAVWVWRDRKKQAATAYRPHLATTDQP